MSSVRRVSPLDAQRLLEEGYAYVDVRTEEEFEDGHPTGAYNVPWAFVSGANSGFVDVIVANFSKEAKLVIGCQSGVRSMKAAELLLASGFVTVVEQRAGFDGSRGPFGELTEAGWRRVGLPIEEGLPDGRSYSALSAARASKDGQDGQDGRAPRGM